MQHEIKTKLYRKLLKQKWKYKPIQNINKYYINNTEITLRAIKNQFLSIKLN